MKITSSIHNAPKSETIKIPKIENIPAVVGATVSDDNGQYVIQGFQPVNGVVNILGYNTEDHMLLSLDPDTLKWVQTEPTLEELESVLYAFEVNRMHCHCEDERPDKAIEEFSKVMHSAYAVAMNNSEATYADFIKGMFIALEIPEPQIENDTQTDEVSESSE